MRAYCVRPTHIVGTFTHHERGEREGGREGRGVRGRVGWGGEERFLTAV